VVSDELKDLFDIRVKREAPPAADQPCEWPGCGHDGPFRAPKSPRELTASRWFCLDHVRRYNAEWDYFAGMKEDEIEDYQRGNMVGHRPTWTLGSNPSRRRQGPRANRTEGVWRYGFEDPLGIIRDHGPAAGKSQEIKSPAARAGEAVRKALSVLELDETASLKEVKTRYKQLVKRYHPDANGGDRQAEERLRQVIQAYRTLKTSGFVS